MACAISRLWRCALHTTSTALLMRRPALLGVCRERHQPLLSSQCSTFVTTATPFSTPSRPHRTSKPGLKVCIVFFQPYLLLLTHPDPPGLAIFTLLEPCDGFLIVELTNGRQRRVEGRPHEGRPMHWGTRSVSDKLFEALLLTRSTQPGPPRIRGFTNSSLVRALHTDPRRFYIPPTHPHNHRVGQSSPLLTVRTDPATSFSFERVKLERRAARCIRGNEYRSCHVSSARALLRSRSC